MAREFALVLSFSACCAVMSETVTMNAEVPAGIKANDTFLAQTDDGQLILLTCEDPANKVVQFTYTKKDVSEHPTDQELFVAAQAIAAQKQEELEKAGLVVKATVGDATFQFEYQAAKFATGQSLTVTRSDGSESPCSVAEVCLTALGPKYNVVIKEAAGNVNKWCDENDLR